MTKITEAEMIEAVKGVALSLRLRNQLGDYNPEEYIALFDAIVDTLERSRWINIKENGLPPSGEYLLGRIDCEVQHGDMVNGKIDHISNEYGESLEPTHYKSLPDPPE